MYHYILDALLLAALVYSCYDRSLGMLNRNGGKLLILVLTLPLWLLGGYTLVFADVDRLKQLNKVTGNHFQTNRLLKNGFRLRWGELGWQVFGDELAFLIIGDGHAFCQRIARQLAAQPLSEAQRAALAAMEGCRPEEARLSATYAVVTGMRSISQALEHGSQEVLRKKAERDAGTSVT